MTRPTQRAVMALTAAAWLTAAPWAAAQEAPDATQTRPAELQTRPAEPGPRMVISSMMHEVGFITRGETIVHSFVVKNEGTETLVIHEVRPECGCTTAGFDKFIAPGGSGKITLQLDTSEFDGEFSKGAKVISNDPILDSVRLVVTASIRHLLDVVPDDLVAFEHYRGDLKKKTVTIHARDGKKWAVKNVEVKGQGLRHELGDATDGSGDKLLTVWLDDSAPLGNMRGKITLLTDHEEQDEVEVTIQGTVHSRLTIKPRRLFFRVPAELPEGARPTKSLALKHRESETIRVIGTRLRGKGLDAAKIDIAVVPDGDLQRVTVAYSGGLPRGKFTGFLVVELADKREPTVELPIYFVVQ